MAYMRLGAGILDTLDDPTQDPNYYRNVEAIGAGQLPRTVVRPKPVTATYGPVSQAVASIKSEVWARALNDTLPGATIIQGYKIFGPVSNWYTFVRPNGSQFKISVSATKSQVKDPTTGKVIYRPASATGTTRGTTTTEKDTPFTIDWDAITGVVSTVAGTTKQILDQRAAARNPVVEEPTEDVGGSLPWGKIAGGAVVGIVAILLVKKALG